MTDNDDGMPSEPSDEESEEFAYEEPEEQPERYDGVSHFPKGDAEEILVAGTLRLRFRHPPEDEVDQARCTPTPDET